MQIRGIASSEEWKECWSCNWKRHDLKRVEILVAYCTRSGAEKIIAAHKTRKPDLFLVVGLNDGITDIHARDCLFEWRNKNPRVEIKTRRLSGARFHPKIYVFHSEAMTRVLIGSVNMTQSAFERNDESSVEWEMTREEWQQQSTLRTVLDEWRNSPATTALQKPSSEERLADMMKHGTFVRIEARLEEARFHATKDLFELGGEVSASAGAVAVRRSVSTSILLTGNEIFKRLESLGEKARKNCREHSFPADIGRFVPATAMRRWQSEHGEIEKEFKQVLKPFACDKERGAIRAAFKKSLPDNVRDICQKLKIKKLSEKKLKEVCRAALKEFDNKSSSFPQTIRLSTLVIQHPFPQTYEAHVISSNHAFASKKFDTQSLAVENDIVSTTDKIKISQDAVQEFARRDSDDIFASWMLELVKTTRSLVRDELSEFLSKNKSGKAATETLEQLSTRLRQLNFYGDRLCLQITQELEGAPDKAEIQSLLKQCKSDLEVVGTWPSSPYSQVLREFENFIDWQLVSPKLEPRELRAQNQLF